ncbi:class I SAM-dependent DNA methyltransferase [Methanobrevibacter sp.]|uniref:class I SAM-dependent DNA methyltransferase n=1 Tax=Methanobrevibacter sp. TaxID=66852 RepID=UPI00388CFF7C
MLKYFTNVHPNENFRKNLDLCCGTGTLCNFFKEQAIETKGVDISGGMLAIALKNYPGIEFIKHDIIDYHDGEKYDFITCTDDALNHITNTDDIKKIIQNVNTHLRVDGLFIFDINYFDIIPLEKVSKSSDNFKNLSYTPQREGNIVKINVEYYENNELLWSDTVCERDYSIEEIAKILNDNNFVIEVFSQYFFDEVRAQKWKCVARKIE